MSFSGRIEDFPVIDIMQYIHASTKSGILFFQNEADQAKIYFREGHIIRATKPQMTNIGDLLLDRGGITKNNLHSALRIQRASQNPNPLGMILEEMGAITHSALRNAIIGQIEQVIYELVTWEEGSFRFELENYEFIDDISVTPDDLIPPEEIDTQYLLVEAMRAFDEKRYKFQQTDEIFNEDNTQEVAYPPEEMEEKDDLDVIRSGLELKSLIKCFSLMKNMLSEVRNCEQNKSISVSFLKILSEHLDRAILFLVRRGELLGLVAFGNTTANGPLNEKIKNLRIPLEDESLAQKCIKRRSSFLGKPPTQAWLNELQDKIGRPANSEVMILPVAGVEKVICLVYGDNGLAERHLNNLELLEVAAGQAGIIFENSFLRKQVQRKIR